MPYFARALKVFFFPFVHVQVSVLLKSCAYDEEPETKKTRHMAKKWERETQTSSRLREVLVDHFQLGKCYKIDCVTVRIWADVKYLNTNPEMPFMNLATFHLMRQKLTTHAHLRVIGQAQKCELCDTRPVLYGMHKVDSWSSSSWPCYNLLSFTCNEHFTS